MVEKWAPEGKPVADKMVAVEYGGASHAGVTRAAKVPAEMAPAKATSVATMHGGSTQSRAGRNNRHGRQCYRYFTDHHAHSICYEVHPSLCEGQQSSSSWSARRCCSMSRLPNPSPKDRSSWEILRDIVLSFGQVALLSECRLRVLFLRRTSTARARFRSNGSVVGWAKPSGPVFGRPDDRLGVPIKGRLVGAARKSAPLPTLQVIPVDRNPRLIARSSRATTR